MNIDLIYYLVSRYKMVRKKDKGKRNCMVCGLCNLECLDDNFENVNCDRFPVEDLIGRCL